MMTHLILFAVLCGFFITQCRSQTCPTGDFFPYSCGWCLSFSSDPQRNFTQAQSACTDLNFGTLAVAETEQQLQALRGYGGALGASFWIGYRYSSVNTLVVATDAGMVAPTFVSSAVSGGVSSGNDTCVAISTDGDLVNVLCSEELGYVCQFNLTDPTVNDIAVMVNGQLVTSQLVVANFSDSLSIECSFYGTDSRSVVQWLLNGKEINSSYVTTDSDRNSSELNIMFETAGVYQCVVTNLDGERASSEVDVCGDIEGANPPSSVSYVVVPENRTTLFLRWLRPEQLNTLHPFLLRYTIFYTTNTTINNGSEQLVSGLMTDANGIGTYFLTGLSVGTEYRVGIRATSGIMMGADPDYVVGVSTYGLAPSDFPGRLRLSRSRDNTALLAEWDPLVTTPPTGEISFYQVEFRSGRPELENAVSTILIDPDFSFASIFGIIGAESYEVRVAGAVRMQRIRSQSAFESGRFTDWVEVTAVVEEVPSSATIGSLEPDNTSTILVAVLVPTLAVLFAVFITVILIVCFFTKPFKIRHDESPKSPTSASNVRTIDEKPIVVEEKPQSSDSAL